MPILPAASILTITVGASSFDVYVDEVVVAYTTEDFVRQEFLASRLRSAPLSDGTEPIIEKNINNTPVQVGYNCVSDEARPLGPSTLTQLNNTYQRFNIDRYTIKGFPTASESLIHIASRARTHQKLLNNFKYHLTKSQEDLSYTDLKNLQLQTFSYLTSTSTSMSGDALDGTVNNILITDFNTDVAYEVTLSDGSKLLVQAWSMVAEVRTIESQVS